MVMGTLVPTKDKHMGRSKWWQGTRAGAAWNSSSASCADAL